MREIVFNDANCVIDGNIYRDFNYVVTGDFDGDGFDEVLLGDQDSQLVIVKDFLPYYFPEPIIDGIVCSIETIRLVGATRTTILLLSLDGSITMCTLEGLSCDTNIVIGRSIGSADFSVVTTFSSEILPPNPTCSKAFRSHGVHHSCFAVGYQDMMLLYRLDIDNETQQFRWIVITEEPTAAPVHSIDISPTGDILFLGLQTGHVLLYFIENLFDPIIGTMEQQQISSEVSVYLSESAVYQEEANTESSSSLFELLDPPSSASSALHLPLSSSMTSLLPSHHQHPITSVSSIASSQCTMEEDGGGAVDFDVYMQSHSARRDYEERYDGSDSSLSFFTASDADIGTSASAGAGNGTSSSRDMARSNDIFSRPRLSEVCELAAAYPENSGEQLLLHQRGTRQQSQSQSGHQQEQQELSSEAEKEQEGGDEEEDSLGDLHKTAYYTNNNSGGNNSTAYNDNTRGGSPLSPSFHDSSNCSSSRGAAGHHHDETMNESVAAGGSWTEVSAASSPAARSTSGNFMSPNPTNHYTASTGLGFEQSPDDAAADAAAISGVIDPHCSSLVVDHRSSSSSPRDSPPLLLYISQLSSMRSMDSTATLAMSQGTGTGTMTHHSSSEWATASAATSLLSIPSGGTRGGCAGASGGGDRTGGPAAGGEEGDSATGTAAAPSALSSPGVKLRLLTQSGGPPPPLPHNVDYIGPAYVRASPHVYASSEIGFAYAGKRHFPPSSQDITATNGNGPPQSSQTATATELHGNFAVGWLDGRICLCAVEAVHRYWPASNKQQQQYTYTTGFRWFVTHCVQSTESIYQLSYFTERIPLDGGSEGYCCVAMSWKGVAIFLANNEVKFTTSTDKLAPPSGCTASGGSSRRNSVSAVCNSVNKNENGRRLPSERKYIASVPDFVCFFDSALSFSHRGGDGSVSRSFACVNMFHQHLPESGNRHYSARSPYQAALLALNGFGQVHVIPDICRQLSGIKKPVIPSTVFSQTAVDTVKKLLGFSKFSPEMASLPPQVRSIIAEAHALVDDHDVEYHGPTSSYNKPAPATMYLKTQFVLGALMRLQSLENVIILSNVTGQP